MKLVEALQKEVFTDRSKAVLLLWIIFVTVFRVCHVSCLFAVALWSPTGKGLTS